METGIRSAQHRSWLHSVHYAGEVTGVPAAVPVTRQPSPQRCREPALGTRMLQGQTDEHRKAALTVVPQAPNPIASPAGDRQDQWGLLGTCPLT